MPWNMCGSQIMFGMLGRLEHEDLGALVAPRPMLIESGTEDLLFPVAAATESVRRTRLVYEQHGAGERLAHDSSTAATSGTAPRPCPSWTAGSATAGPPAPGPEGGRRVSAHVVGPLGPRRGSPSEHLVE